MPMATHDRASALHTAALELKYERSNHTVDVICREEDLRQLRFDKHILEDDIMDLRELLHSEQDRADKLEALMNTHLERAEEAEGALQDLEACAQVQEQEIASLQAERNALKNLTTDTSKLVTEKMELTHEISRIKPELEYLRTQTATNEALLAEKLALQRSVSELEVELENAKRDAQRAMAKRRNTMHEVAQEDELETLRKSLSKEKRLHERAQDTIKELQSELQELRTSQQQGLAAESASDERLAEAEARAQQLTRDLAKEQKEKAKAERALSVAQSDFESTKAVLEDKLEQYKNRVRTLKDRLKVAETSLEEAQSIAAKATSKPTKSVTIAAPAVPAAKQTKSRKRPAGTIDPDATNLGTPGDAPAKRARKGASVGEKSAFSITPFLNRTMNISGDISDHEEAATPVPATTTASEPSEEEDQPEAEPEEEPVVTTPTAAPKQHKKKQPLQPVPASKQNSQKPAPPAKAPKLVLQAVEEVDEPASPVKTTAAAAPAPIPTAVPKPKMRKSLATFAAFTRDPEPERKKPKARKLAGLGKTLFDEEEDVGVAAGPLGRKVSGGLFGKLPRGGLGGGSLLLGKQRNDDGFVFSPLKRDRKGSGMSFLK